MKILAAGTACGSLRAPPLLDSRYALFLDFDGALSKPAAAPAVLGRRLDVPGLLAELDQRLEGAVAVMSRQRIESLDHYLKPVRLHAASLDGAQLRVDGTIVTVDTKPEVETLDRRPALVPSLSKELAIRSLMRSKAFRKKIPVFVGNDVSDEDALRDVQSFGGLGVRVGSGPSVARCRLDDSAAVFDWLCQSLRSMIEAPPPPRRLPLPYLRLRSPGTSETSNNLPRRRQA